MFSLREGHLSGLCDLKRLSRVLHGRDDYKFVEMIRQKPLLGILSCNLIGHPYITLERQCISGRTYSQNDLENVRCQTVIIVSAWQL